MKTRSYRFSRYFNNCLIYFVLTFFAVVMLFPFLYMLTTSFKIPADTFRYPPRMLPRDPVTVTVEGYEEPLPVYYVKVNGQQAEYALAQSNIKVGTYAPPGDLTATVERYLSARGVRARRRPHPHRRHPQLRGRGLLRPRGQHQDPAGGRPGPRYRGAQRAAGPDDR